MSRNRLGLDSHIQILFDGSTAIPTGRLKVTDGARVVTQPLVDILRIRLFRVSATKRLPCGSKQTEDGESNWAARAGPSEYPRARDPANVRTTVRSLRSRSY